METWECAHCHDRWYDYQPKICPFCYSEEIHKVAESEILKEDEQYAFQGPDSSG